MQKSNIFKTEKTLIYKHKFILDERHKSADQQQSD